MKQATIERNRVRNVIYPLLACPAIVKQGDRLTIEYDPRDQHWDKPLPLITAFEVSVKATNCARPLTRELPVKRVEVGFSSHWPEYAEEVQPRALVYLVTVEVPASLPVHLYDLEVEAMMGGGDRVTDAQPHALQVVERFKIDYTFTQFTDIHVWGPEATYIGANTHDRNWRHPRWREQDGYGAGYYHKAIQQMNRAKPDFLVYTGDYDFGLTWLYRRDYADFTEYADSPWAQRLYETWFELDWFYKETLKLEVPVFMLPGNHDGWVRYDQRNETLEEDYLVSWRQLFGPQYFSFDYGPDNHFVAVNSMDWPPEQRNLHWAGPPGLLGPHKWQGQVRGGGDQFKPGWSERREEAVDEEAFTDQLAWIKRDIEAHDGARFKAMLIHHDPWKTDGSGSMFDDMAISTVPSMGGKGSGRLALIKLCREHRVGVVLSGHDHTDSYGKVAWKDGTGEVQFANTVSLQGQDGDWHARWSYPGYRFVKVKNGIVVTCYYKVADDENGREQHYSWPTYAKTNVGGPTDLHTLELPCISTVWSQRPGKAERAECAITNRLDGQRISGAGWSGDLDQAYIEFPMPILRGGFYYVVDGGDIVDIFDADAGKHRIVGVMTLVEHSSSRTIQISKSEKPAAKAPSCASFRIDGGAKSTKRARVTLTNDALDRGGAGLLHMKFWNDGDSEKDAEWQRYAPRADWELRHQPGKRTVFVRFVDAAMPGNVSKVYSATINLAGDTPTIASVAPEAARVGDTVTIKGAGFGKRAEASDVLFNGITTPVVSWTDGKITCTVPRGVWSGKITVITDLGSAGAMFKVTPVIERIVPHYACNCGTVHIENLEGRGFPSGKVSVKLSNGTVNINAGRLKVVSPQSITCDFDLTGAPVGYYDVQLTGEDGDSARLPGGLTIDCPPPTVTSVKPGSVKRTGTVEMSITGRHLQDGLRAWLVRGETEVEAEKTVVKSATTAGFTFALKNVPKGDWKLRVCNVNGKSASLTQALTVK